MAFQRRGEFAAVLALSYGGALMLTAALLMAAAGFAPHADAEEPPYPLWTGEPLPAAADIAEVEDAEFHVIKTWEPEEDGYEWLHGVALAWRGGQLYASFGLNSGRENTPGEEARGRLSRDGGASWGELFTIAEPDEEDLGISHGAFLSHESGLWAFQGAFHDRRERVHTRAYRLNEETGEWEDHGVIIEDGFWPMQEPQLMDDGNWIMAGLRCAREYADPDNHAAVAISEGDDFTQWELVVIPNQAPGEMWGESTVFLDGSRVINVSRYQAEPIALAAVSEDYGRTWTPSRPSNLPMASSKPYTGSLSTGQHYLICTTTADSGNRRHPLTIAVTRPGETTFSKVFVIRRALFDDGPGESAPDARLAYPYAVEHQGKLYVGYSNSGERGGNRNSAELAVIPLESLDAG